MKNNNYKKNFLLIALISLTTLGMAQKGLDLANKSIIELGLIMEGNVFSNGDLQAINAFPKVKNVYHSSGFSLKFSPGRLQSGLGIEWLRLNPLMNKAKGGSVENVSIYGHTIRLSYFLNKHLNQKSKLTFSLGVSKNYTLLEVEGLTPENNPFEWLSINPETKPLTFEFEQSEEELGITGTVGYYYTLFSKWSLGINAGYYHPVKRVEFWVLANNDRQRKPVVMEINQLDFQNFYLQLSVQRGLF